MKPLTILLVEDEPVISLGLELELVQYGHQVMNASDAETAFQVCNQNLPDLAIINFLYENTKDGMALARFLCTRFIVPVLFITGARWEDMEKSPYFYAGHEVLFKPYTRLQFQAALNAVVEEADKMKAV